MRSYLGFLVLLLLANKLSAQALHSFTLSGNIKGVDEGYVFLHYLKSDGNGISDSCHLHHGFFSIKGLMTEPSMAFFRVSDMAGLQDANSLIEFYMEPGEMTLNIDTNDFQNFVLTGSKSQDEYHRLRQSESSTRAKITIYEQKLNFLNEDKSQMNASSKKYRIDSISNILTELFNEVLGRDSEFIAQNNDSYISADLLSRSKADWLSFESFKGLYGSFTKRIKESMAGKRIGREIEREESISIGKSAMDFVVVDSKGDTVRLSDFKGKKLVLLDFGASWCGPCIQIIPFLKKEYEKYKENLEIISIDQESDKDKWEIFLDREAMSWPQIFDNKSNFPIFPSDQTITDLYHIDLIPALILLDKHAKIVAKLGSFYSSPRGYLPVLDAQLESLLSD